MFYQGYVDCKSTFVIFKNIHIVSNDDFYVLTYTPELTVLFFDKLSYYDSKLFLSTEAHFHF